jgi:acyl-CoA dehydrogenase family protein 9
MKQLKPSFTRGLFSGAIHDALLFPYPDPLEKRDAGEARLVRRLIGELRHLRGEGFIDSARFDEEERIPEELFRAFAELGLFGMSIPKEYGGLGLSATAYAKLSGAISAMDPSLGVVIGVHCGLGSKAIVLFGSAEQKARYLPMLARGETFAAYALTEPETGSDAQHIVTRAHLSEDGSHWLLNGRKHWIGLGHRAGVIATFAQTPVDRKGERAQRPTAFIVRPDMPGFTVVGTVRKMGIRGSTQAELRYTDLRVPVDHVLGQVGKGFAVAVTVLNGGRHTLAAGCAQAAKVVLDEMATYAETRMQFGAPLASFEITQRKLARVAAETYAADAMVGILSSMVDRGDTDYSLEAACAKVFASEMIWNATDELVQVAGGRGFVKPWPYERMLRDSRINRIFEGANEVLRLFIALNGLQGPGERLTELGTALRAPLRNWGLVTGFASARVRTAFGGTTDRIDYALHTRLRQHKEYFERHAAELSVAAERAIRKHRKRIVERQLVVERLANMAIDLFATAATLARTQRLIEERGVAGCDRELALCDLFCVEAGRRFKANREALAGREDDVDATRREVAAAVREARGYYVPDAVLDTRGRNADPGGPVPEAETAPPRGAVRAS